MGKFITATLALAGLCAAAQAQDLHDHGAVQVTVSGGQIDDLDDVQTTADEGALVWAIDSRGYRFADSDGIVVKSGGRHVCRTIADGLRVRCVKLGHNRGDRFKYDINLVGPNGAQITLDPYIVSK